MTLMRKKQRTLWNDLNEKETGLSGMTLMRKEQKTLWNDLNEKERKDSLE